jgi:hypothetical protein
LTVVGTAANRVIVDVTGPVVHIEGAFHVIMGVYQHPTEGRTFYAANREPTPDLPFPLWHITGLDNFSIPHPASLRKDPEVKYRPTGSGPDGNFIDNHLRGIARSEALSDRAYHRREGRRAELAETANRNQLTWH